MEMQSDDSLHTFKTDNIQNTHHTNQLLVRNIGKLNTVKGNANG